MGAIKSGAHSWPETKKKVLIVTKTIESYSEYEPTRASLEDVQPAETGLRKRKRDNGMENISLSDMAIHEMDAVEKALNMAIPTIVGNTEAFKEDLPLHFDQQMSDEEKTKNVLKRKDTIRMQNEDNKG